MLKEFMESMSNLEVDNEKRSELGKLLAKKQRQLAQDKSSLVILLDGFESSGRALIIKDLIRELDPRYLNVLSFDVANKNEKRYPFLRRFAIDLPQIGSITIYDRSFYYELFNDLKIRDKDLEKKVNDLAFFENLLLQDNTVVVKFFLVQSKKTMKKRVKQLEENPDLHFFVDHQDALQLQEYNKYLSHFERVLNLSTNVKCPWHLVMTDDLKAASRFVLMSVNNMLDIHFQRDRSEPNIYLPPLMRFPVSNVDLTPYLVEEEYNQKLEDLQRKASELVYKMYSRHKRAIIVFEGTDAAGKGGAIKRLMRYMDPRMVRVATTAAPSKEELYHHYLWRFYKTLPASGHITIYDRSWYGRVMVERLEQFTPLYRTQQAYQEINDFEKSLADQDTLVIKFLICISKEEQYLRFMARQNNPEKSYKLTDEDWRNHDKYADYVKVMDEMVERTDKAYAPWILISGTDKRYARVKVLEEFINAASKLLDN